jgi:hypothetical protein
MQVYIISRFDFLKHVDKSIVQALVNELAAPLGPSAQDRRGKQQQQQQQQQALTDGTAEVQKTTGGTGAEGGDGGGGDAEGLGNDGRFDIGLSDDKVGDDSDLGGRRESRGGGTHMAPPLGYFLSTFKGFLLSKHT